MSAFAHLRRDEPGEALLALDRVDSRDQRLLNRVAVLRARATDELHGGCESTQDQLQDPCVSADPEAFGLAKYFAALSGLRNGRQQEPVELLKSITSSAGEWVRAMSITRLGWIEVRRFHLPEAMRYFVDANRLFADPATRDGFVSMNALFGLASCALDGLNLSAMSTLEEGLAILPARSDFSGMKAQCLNRVAQVFEISGAEDRALDLLLDARGIRGSGTKGVEPLLSLTELHRRAGESFSADHHRARARQLLDAVDWSDASVDERLLLLQLSTLYENEDESLASKMYIRAVSARGRTDPMLVFEDDERANAFVMYAEGFLLQARGDHARAVECWRNALSIWAAIGYRFRAAQAEWWIRQLSTSPTLTPNLDNARRETPKAWLVGRTHSERSTTTVSKPPPRTHRELGPAEQRVLELICDGLSGPEIARTVGRSISTIKNQTVRIFRTFEVNDRPSLIAKARSGQELADYPGQLDGTAAGPAQIRNLPADRPRKRQSSAKTKR